MPTTTLKLPEELKKRITFVAAAHAAEQEVAEYGLVYDADEIFSYLQDKLKGRRTKYPRGQALSSAGRVTSQVFSFYC